MRVLIAGSRDYPNLFEVSAYVRDLPVGDTVIVGGARGVDTAAEEAAETRPDLGLAVYVADWDTYGRAAGYRRNAEMVKHADRVVVFWDGQSRGSKHTIDLTLEARKDLEVHFP